MGLSADGFTLNFRSMKKVFFVRHAKSSWQQSGLRDHDRPLNDRGHADAPVMAEHLRDNGWPIDFLLSSTAVRAKTTADYFLEVFGIGQDAFWTDSDLYHSYPETMISCLSQVPDEYENVALFAHNPGMTYLANAVSESTIDNVPTCGVVITEFEGSFSDLNLSKLHFLSFLYPKGI